MMELFLINLDGNEKLVNVILIFLKLINKY